MFRGSIDTGMCITIGVATLALVVAMGASRSAPHFDFASHDCVRSIEGMPSARLEHGALEAIEVMPGSAVERVDVRVSPMVRTRARHSRTEIGDTVMVMRPSFEARAELPCRLLEEHALMDKVRMLHAEDAALSRVRRHER
jgi:hypothetical protein